MILKASGQSKEKYSIERNVAAEKGHLLNWQYKFQFSYLQVDPILPVCI